MDIEQVEYIMSDLEDEYVLFDENMEHVITINRENTMDYDIHKGLLCVFQEDKCIYINTGNISMIEVVHGD